MNTFLEKLFEKHSISEKNRYEIMQIYELLPPDKKQNILNNFDTLAFRLEKIEQEVVVEREILLGDAILDIKNVIDRVKKKRLQNEANNRMNILKQRV